jgi:hypothetical protein
VRKEEADIGHPRLGQPLVGDQVDDRRLSPAAGQVPHEGRSQGTVGANHPRHAMTLGQRGLQRPERLAQTEPVGQVGDGGGG